MPTTDEDVHTPGPWGASEHRKLSGIHSPKHWVYVKHEFPDYPYEGDLENEFGIYPPLGEAGPVALVSGEKNAQLVAAVPDLLDGCIALLGLIQLVCHRDDMPMEIREALTSNYRIAEAQAAIAKAKRGTEK